MEYSLNPEAEAARDRWFGSQAAADYLGIHRSTLFLAMQREHLIPDDHTPGGFARFRQSTLEAFRRRLSEEAATSTVPIYAPIHTLAQLARDVKDMTPVWSQRHRFLFEKKVPREVKDVCESVIAAISKPPVSAQMCLLALRTFDPDPLNAYKLKIVAQSGIGPDFIRDYTWLRSQPGAQFVTDETLKYGKEAYCPDTSCDPSPFKSSQQFIKAQGIGSYLALPISSGDLTLGLLLIVDHAPRQFSQHERAFLKGVTDQVALAINSYTRSMRLDTYANAGQRLTQIGLEAQADLRCAMSKVERLEAQRDRIADLLNIFKEVSNADNAYVANLPGIEAPADIPCGLGQLTADALNMSHPVGAHSSQPAPLAYRYHKNEKGLYVGEWQARGSHYNGLALGITVPPSTSAAVGASWCLLPAPGTPKSDTLDAPITPEDHALLVTLAGACALIMSAS